jgi:phage terminase large subunit
MILTVKQTQALDYLEDKTTRELVFGGGAGGAKSVLGCYWGVKQCIKYPGIRGLIGRTVLKTLKETTLQSLWWVCAQQGLQLNVHYKYNETKGLVTFYNGSEILLKDCEFKPGDENFDRFGSLEITWAFIDECNQLRKKAWDVIKSRIRYKLDEYGLLPKILGTCNPAKNWVYMNFYDPDRKGSIPTDRKFVQSLAKDNPFISKYYIEQLDRLDDLNLRARLLLGLWDYDDDPASLCQFDAIADAFTNAGAKSGDRRVSADLAMQGRARFVSVYWDGLIAEIAIDEQKSTGKSIETSLKNLMVTRGVGRSQTVVDSDGLGNYLESYLVGIKEFRGGGKASSDKEYANIKAECGYQTGLLHQ